MGQYYRPTILGQNKKTVKAWVYSHEYSSGLKLMEHSWVENPFVGAFETLIFNNPQRVVWGGDYAEPCKGRKTNISDRCLEKLKVKPNLEKTGNYIVNHSKNIFVDKRKVINNDGWKIHPLPLLTCEGNGQGGGDFFGEDPNNLIGSWSRDLISVETKRPKDFTELLFDLVEK